MNDWKKRLKKTWKFVWEEDSAASWLVNIAVAFILIKFIVYPGLGWMVGTSYPVVAVVSGSMEHDGTFEHWWNAPAVCSVANCRQKDWYRQNGITEQEFKTFIFKNGFNKGDIMVLVGTPPEKIEVGDVIVFSSTKPYPIIHRVVDIDENGARVFTTKGDHNPNTGPDDLDINEKNVLGRAVFRIPFLGWVKIIVFDALNLVIGIIK